MIPSYPRPVRPAAALVALFRLCIVALMACCLGAFAAPATSAATGTVRGRVVNAANGMYVSKAVVSVDGTTTQTLTDDYGYYTLNDVPAGVANLTVTYTGEGALHSSVQVAAGAAANQDFMFNREKAEQTSGEGKVVKLDQYVVQSERFKTAAEIALNEQRYSPTIKNVVAAGSFGDIPDGNVGEFVKYIPGVQVGTGYSNTGMNAADNNITNISIRGFGPEMTQITVDGVPLTNASPASLTRAIGVDMMSINNASRVEVIKVPTPDMPSDSPGGSVNLVSKSAFEYAKPTLNFQITSSFNSEDRSTIFKKTPGPANKPTYKTIPGATFTYVIPITKNMGLALTGAWTRTFNENHRAQLDHFYDTRDVNSNSSFKVDLTPGGGPLVDVKNGLMYQSINGQPLDLAHPLLWRFQATDTPNTDTRTSGSLKYDWRPTPNQLLQVGYTLGLFSTVDAQRRLQFNANKAYYMDWGPDFTTTYKFIPKGTVVNGKALTSDFNPGVTVDNDVITRDRDATTHTGYLKYNFNSGPWRIDAQASGSRSRGSYADLKNGHFSELETTLSAGQLMFKNIHDSMPGTVLVYDKSGAPLDWTNMANWNAPTITAKSGETEAMDQHIMMRVDVARDLDFIRWTDVTAKTGWYRDQEHQRKWGVGTGFKMTYYGPTLALSDYTDTSYTKSPGFGLPAQQWLDTYKLYSLWQQNPSYFNGNSDSDAGSNYQSWANQQKDLTETSDQYYFMLNGKALHNRLNWVLGSREEISTRKGYATRKISSWNYIKNPDGSVYRDAAHPQGVRLDQSSSDLFATNAAGTALRSSLSAAKISYPDHVITNSSTGGTFLDYSKLAFLPFLNMDGRVTGKPTFTASGKYNITENLEGTLSWNRSEARPDFENGVLTQTQGTSISDNADPTAIPAGTITIANPDLKPWIADSFNFELSYYTRSGGSFSVNPFITFTKNFQDSESFVSGDPQFDAILAAQGLDPTTYQNYQINTTVNGTGTSKTVGYEVNAQQNLKILGNWGSHFQVFGSYSHHYVKQNNTTLLTQKPLSGSTASAGVTFSSRRFRAQLRGLFMQKKYVSANTTYVYNGVPIKPAQWNPSMVQLDLNTAYQITSHYSFFLDARNFLNRSVDTLYYDSAGIIPDYAKHVDRKQFGITWYFGINGNF